MSRFYTHRAENLALLVAQEMLEERNSLPSLVSSVSKEVPIGGGSLSSWNPSHSSVSRFAAVRPPFTNSDNGTLG